MAYAEHDFMRRFMPKYGYDLEIIARTAFGRLASFVAFWPAKQVLVLAERTYRHLEGTLNQWEGIYYFSPRRTKIERFIELVGGMTPESEESPILHFMGRFSESQRTRVLQRLTTRVIQGLTRRSYIA